jgi:hypothetical protein
MRGSSVGAQAPCSPLCRGFRAPCTVAWRLRVASQLLTVHCWQFERSRLLDRRSCIFLDRRRIGRHIRLRLSESNQREVNRARRGFVAVISGRVVAGFPPRRPRFECRSGHMGFVVDRAALGQGYPSTSVSLCHPSHRLVHKRHHKNSPNVSIQNIKKTN